MMARRRILTELTLDKIAAVDFPCNEHATVAIIKRADPIRKMGAELRKMDLPAARGFAEILLEAEGRKLRWEAEAKMWPLFDALRESLGSIAADPALDSAARVDLVEESVIEFVGALKAEWPDVAEEVEKIAKGSANRDRMAAFIKAGAAGGNGKEDTMVSFESAVSAIQKRDGIGRLAALEKVVREAPGAVESYRRAGPIASPPADDDDDGDRALAKERFNSKISDMMAQHDIGRAAALARAPKEAPAEFRAAFG